MVETARLDWRHDGRVSELAFFAAEGPAHLSPAEQLATLVDDCAEALAKRELTLENLVHQRVWLRDRTVRDAIDGPRRILLGDDRRAPSSSFISAAHFKSGGAVAVELLAQRPEAPSQRRLVDFVPPRRYAWYLLQDGWLHFSGMAEAGDGLPAQFDAACAAIEDGLAAEGRDWRHVSHTRLFLERGKGEEHWLRQSFAQRSGLLATAARFDWVDGLASSNKHLEIEAVARPA